MFARLWNADAIKAERVIDRVGVCKQSVAGDQGDGLQGLPGCEVCRKLDGGLRNAKCSEPELESAVGKALCGVGNDHGGTDQSERIGCDAAGGLASSMQERTSRIHRVAKNADGFSIKFAIRIPGRERTGIDIERGQSMTSLACHRAKIASDKNQIG